MKQETIFYPECWHKVVYDFDDSDDIVAILHFKAFEITSLDEENPELSDVEEEPCIVGFVKWDDCCEFKYKTHVCGLYGIERFHELMKEVYKMKEIICGDL